MATAHYGPAGERIVKGALNSGRPAARADAGRLQPVTRGDEAVRGRDALEPAVELAVGQLDDAVALRADEMVMMLLAAEPVARLRRAVHQGVDDSALAEQREGAVHGGETDPHPAGGELGVDLLGGGVVRLFGERAEHGEPLLGRLDAPAGERLSGIELLRRHGIRTIPPSENENHS